MDINAAFPSKYISHTDLQGRAVDVVMGEVTMADVDGRGEMKPVLHFQGKAKGLVLNKTNSARITDMYGSDTDAWFGRTICLYESETEFQGKTVACIRVNAPGNMMVSAWKQQLAQQAVQPAHSNVGQPVPSAQLATQQAPAQPVVSNDIDDSIPF